TTGALIGAVIPPEGWQAIPMPNTTTSAQTRAALSFDPQERVRVRTRDHKYSGTVSSSTDTSITIVGSEATQVAWSDVTQLKLRGGRHRVRGAVMGAAALVAFGI